MPSSDVCLLFLTIFDKNQYIQVHFLPKHRMHYMSEYKIHKMSIMISVAKQGNLGQVKKPNHGSALELILFCDPDFCEKETTFLIAIFGYRFFAQ